MRARPVAWRVAKPVLCRPLLQAAAKAAEEAADLARTTVIERKRFKSEQQRLQQQRLEFARQREREEQEALEREQAQAARLQAEKEARDAELARQQKQLLEQQRAMMMTDGGDALKQTIAACAAERPHGGIDGVGAPGREERPEG